MLELVLATVLVSTPANLTQSGLPPEVQAGLDAWRNDYGASWQVLLDEETQMARLLFNGNAAYPPIQPSSDKERIDLARADLRKAYSIFGLDEATLVSDRVRFLPLGMIGATDKRVVRFLQEVDGVPVVDASVHVILASDDKLLAIDSQALPQLRGLDTVPTVTPLAALAQATSKFLQDTGVLAETHSAPELKIFPLTRNGTRAPALAWEVEVTAEDASGMALAYLYRVAAQGDVEVIDREDRVFNAFPCQQRGGGSIHVTVKANVTRGDDGDGIEELQQDWIPDDGTNYVTRPMPYLTVWRVLPDGSRAVIATTNAEGAFSLPASLAGIEVEVDFRGTYVDVCNMPVNERNFCTPCSNSPVSKTLTPGSNSIVMNATYDEARIAQANAYYYANSIRQWIRSVDPTDSTFDDGPDPETLQELPGEEQTAPYKIRPNYDGGAVLDPCGAMFRGRCVPFGPGQIYDFLQFSRSTLGPSSCPNTSYSTVVIHEMGHWLNELYGNGNRQPFAEGVADAWALYVTDSPQIGTGVAPRNGDNLSQFCGDCPPGPTPCTHCQECYIETHENGRVLMGALWKVRRRLKEDLGDSFGAAVSNALFLAWMQAFDTNRILSVIEYQWLVLDCDGSGRLDLAPHLGSIDAGFREQGFPGFQLPPFRYDCHEHE